MTNWMRLQNKSKSVCKNIATKQQRKTRWFTIFTSSLERSYPNRMIHCLEDALCAWRNFVMTRSSWWNKRLQIGLILLELINAFTGSTWSVFTENGSWTGKLKLMSSAAKLFIQCLKRRSAQFAAMKYQLRIWRIFEASIALSLKLLKTTTMIDTL